MDIFMKWKSRKHKYGAKRCKRGEIKFPSILERSVYDLLTTLKNSGEVLFFLMQIPIKIGGGHKYVCDYLVFTKEECFFIEVKGKMTNEAKLKIDLAEDVLNCQIHVVYKADEILPIIFPSNIT